MPSNSEANQNQNFRIELFREAIPTREQLKQNPEQSIYKFCRALQLLQLETVNSELLRGVSFQITIENIFKNLTQDELVRLVALYSSKKFQKFIRFTNLWIINFEFQNRVIDHLPPSVNNTEMRSKISQTSTTLFLLSPKYEGLGSIFIELWNSLVDQNQTALISRLNKVVKGQEQTNIKIAFEGDIKNLVSSLKKDHYYVTYSFLMEALSKIKNEKQQAAQINFKVFLEEYLKKHLFIELVFPLKNKSEIAWLTQFLQILEEVFRTFRAAKKNRFQAIMNCLHQDYVVIIDGSPIKLHDTEKQLDNLSTIADQLMQIEKELKKSTEINMLLKTKSSKKDKQGIESPLIDLLVTSVVSAQLDKAKIRKYKEDEIENQMQAVVDNNQHGPLTPKSLRFPDPQPLDLAPYKIGGFDIVSLMTGISFSAIAAAAATYLTIQLILVPTLTAVAIGTIIIATVAALAAVFMLALAFHKDVLNLGVKIKHKHNEKQHLPKLNEPSSAGLWNSEPQVAPKQVKTKPKKPSLFEAIKGIVQKTPAEPGLVISKNNL